MRIEDYWDDVEVYYVEFVVQLIDIKKTMNKIVVFDYEIEATIPELIQKKFKNVIQINFIDNIGEGLHLKKEG